jgi:hypothetical protein
VLDLDEDRRLKVIGCVRGVAVDEGHESPPEGVFGRKYRHMRSSFLSNPDM